MNRIAIIDMGTNTFHLLIAETGPDASLETVHRDHEAVRIGLNGINDGFITDSACDRARAAMIRFKDTIDRYGVKTIFAFGTSALRNARNASALAADIRSATGISVEIISGDKEAAYIFDGAKAAIDLGEHPNLVMDIGAGSVEFIIGDKEKIFWKQSFEIGGQRLLEKFQKHDPIIPEEIQALDGYFEEELKELTEALRKFNPPILIGSSGSFDTLSNIFCIRQGIAYDADAPETPLTQEGFYDIYRELIRKRRDERMHIAGMIALRVDMIVVASCLIRFLLEKHTFERIRVSTWSLKEGVVNRLAKGIGIL